MGMGLLIFLTITTLFITIVVVVAAILLMLPGIMYLTKHTRTCVYRGTESLIFS